ncbi:MAG TPA: O-antigen ligase family protein [Longimicrobiales bacterium]|nr:O-antigen ligase family protein [Longimicrobiales bacterium]
MSGVAAQPPARGVTWEAAWLAGAGLSAVVAAFALARQPFFAAGVVFGGLLLMVTLVRPLAIMAAMLVIGPIDLSFLTGGFKSLLEEQGGLDMNGIRLIGMVVALGVMTVADRDLLRIAAARYGRWWLVFLAYAAASLAFTTSLVDGLRLLLKLAYPFLLFVGILGVVRTRAELERLASWLLWGAAAITLLLAPALVALGHYELDQGRVRIPMIGVHENPMSFYLLMVILVAFTRFTTRGHYRYLGLCLACGAWIAVAMTRITVLAALASFAGCALFAAVVVRNYRGVLAAVVVGALLGVALLPTALERTFGYVPGAGELAALAAHPAQLFRSMNFQGREIFWALVLKSFLAHPWVGEGLGSSTALILRNFPPSWGGVVHNEYLRLLSELGVVGVALFALAVFKWWGAVVRAARRADPLVREFALPAFAGLVAWATISLTDNTFDYYAPFTQYVAFLCAGALAAAALPGGAAGAWSGGAAPGAAPAGPPLPAPAGPALTAPAAPGATERGGA